MVVKSCSIETCESCSAREEDVGVTYLKLPKDASVRERWVSVCRLRDTQPAYVCSRHFCTNDFEKLGSKYVLKSDAIPSIFPWNKEELTKTLKPEEKQQEKFDKEKETLNPEEKGLKENIDKEEEKGAKMDVAHDDSSPINLEINETNALDSSTESVAENLEAIRDFIAAQEQEILDNKAEIEREANLKAAETPAKVNELCDEILEKEIDVEKIESGNQMKENEDTGSSQSKIVEEQDKNIIGSISENEENDKHTENINVPLDKEETKEKSTMEIASVNKDDSMEEAVHIMEKILAETEARVAEESEAKSEKSDKPAMKQIMSTSEKGNTMALSVGSRLEARDFGDDWHPAQILEVDFEEMEVLVHYEVASKRLVRPDEWISVSSPRLRPEGSGPVRGLSPDPEPEPVTPEAPAVEEIKHEEKPKLSFEVGERCLARWRDNRRFIATVTLDLGEGIYEILFDDGARWSCNTTRLYKLKEKKDGRDSICAEKLTTPTQLPLPIASGSQSAPVAPLPFFNTHLFDPARDYLGSKSERREMKRKLNIKEIFNIGQKKCKKMDTPKTSKPRAPPRERKPKVVKKKLVMAKEVKMEVEVPAIKNEIDPFKKVIDPVRKEIDPVKKGIDPVKKEIPSPVIKKVPVKHDTASIKKETVSPVIKKVPDTASIKKETVSPVIKKVAVKNEIVSVKKEVSSPVTKKEIPEYIASIIGTLKKEAPEPEPERTEEPKDLQELKQELPDIVEVDPSDVKIDVDDSLQLTDSETLSAPESQEMKHDVKDVDEEIKIESFETQENSQSGEVIDRIKEVITKLEDGLSEIETKSDIIKNIDSPKVVIKEDDIILSSLKPSIEDKTKNLEKVKKGKKMRLLQEKRVKKQVEKVKSELETMKKQMEEMKKAMLLKTEEISKGNGSVEMPESFLLPGEWCCKWVNGQPVGTVSEMEGDVRVGVDNKPALPRRSVQVEDKRLPEGWTKHMVRRSFGNSAGKWDVVLVSPENRRFHTKTEMGMYLEHNPTQAEALKDYELALFDFGVHLKLSRRMGWYTTTEDGHQIPPAFKLPAGTLDTTSPLVKKKKLSLSKRDREKIRKEKNRERCRKAEPKLSKAALMKAYANYPALVAGESSLDQPIAGPSVPIEPELGVAPLAPLEDGCVYVGSLKVQIIENLLRCPAEGCFKNFRNNTLLKMHIKHYHRELRVMLGTTPKVLDLAYARTRPTALGRQLKLEADRRTFKVKPPKLPKRVLEKAEAKEVKLEPIDSSTPIKPELIKTPRSQDSPKLRTALAKHVRRPKVLLPVKKPEITTEIKLEIQTCKQEAPMEVLDFETAISTHTVTKPAQFSAQRKSLASVSKMSEDEDWMGSDPDTRSSYPRSGTPDSKNMDHKFVSSESNNEDLKDATYMFTETGERIKIVHMKREEIINCHCGFREEDGLMVQCELCLCWQHALCHNIQREVDVPEKYTCSICLNPRRGRRSQRFLHDQDRLYEGLLPGAKPCESLRRSHELSGNLIRIQDALHALRVKYFVATNKNHPKLYLWAKDWEMGELNLIQERLNSDYSDLNIMISSLGKENLPLKDEIKDLQVIPMDMHNSPSEDTDMERFNQKDNQIGSQSLLSGLLSSPGGASLDLPISTSELERLAKTVQEEAQRVIVPQPEAAIENSVCRERLLKHIQRCQALVDARLDSIEAQVAELESQDPSFEDDETADFFPRTKQTVQMLMRDLDTMEELGVIT